MKRFRLSRFALVLVVILIVLGTVGVWLLRRSGSYKVRNVILISIDTCRDDYLSCYGYRRQTTPNIDQLAKESTLFSNVITPVPTTLPAHCSMLTGTIPSYHGVHNNFEFKLGESNLTLAEILRPKGFTTGAIVSAFILDSKFGLDQGFDYYNDHFEDPLNTFSETVNERRGEEASRFAIEWLEENKDKKFFLFLHYYDPHSEYVPPEPFASRFADSLYAGEIAYTDYCIGQVIERLKKLGLYDSTLIIITGDHGEMLGEHGEKEHGYFIYRAAIRVPLIFKLPGRTKPQRIEQLAGLVDIVPTICTMLGIEIPSQVQGKDVSACFGRKRVSGRERYLYCECLIPTSYNANSLLSVVTDRWKYIQTTRPELYDVVEDPHETNNRIKQRPQLARILQDHLKQILEQTVRQGHSDSKIELNEQTLERLKSLGYVASGISEDFEFDQSKDDPKDLIGLHELFMKANYLAFQKKHAEADAIYEKMLLERPDFYKAWVNMARIAVKQKDFDRAVSHYLEALKIDPELSEVYSNLGNVMVQQGKWDEAIAYLKKALRLDPEIAQAHYNLAHALSQQKKVDEALVHLYEAVRLAPEQLEVQNGLGRVLLQQGKMAEAIEHYKKSLQIKPDQPQVCQNIGIAFAQLERFDEAIAYFKRALELVPDMSSVYYNLATVFRRQGKPHQAISHYKMALLYNPDMSKANYSLGNVYIKQGRLDDAITEYNKALKINPDFVEAHCNLGTALVKQGKFDQAIVHYNKALTLSPDCRQARMGLSIVENQKKKLGKPTGEAENR